VGDEVLLKKHNSLQRKFESPYEEVEFEVFETKGQGAYQIKDTLSRGFYDINRKDLAKISQDTTEAKGEELDSIGGRLSTAADTDISNEAIDCLKSKTYLRQIVSDLK
jgi:hypothetical protein